MRRNLILIAAVSVFAGCGRSDATVEQQRLQLERDRLELERQRVALEKQRHSPGRPSDGRSIARIQVTGTDGTPELQRLVATLSDVEIAALGIGALLSGTDIYAARVKIANTGNVPVPITPENLAVHFGTETARTYSAEHPSFLRPGLLQPGYYFEGLVLYQARIDVGAAMRLGGGGISYRDPALDVTYAR